MTLTTRGVGANVNLLLVMDILDEIERLKRELFDIDDSSGPKSSQADLPSLNSNPLLDTDSVLESLFSFTRNNDFDYDR